jgi:hypothetical protein
MGAAVLAGIVYTGAVIGHEASKIDWGGWFASDDSSTELTPKDAQRAVEKGRGPKGISRIDEPEQSVTGSQWEAHTGGRGSPALKQDGTWKHVPRGKSPPSLPRKTIEWLRRHGWDT